MAVVKGASKIRFDGAVGAFREWTATCSTTDQVDGASVTINFTQTSGGIAPGEADTLDCQFVTDGGTVIKTFTLPTAQSSFPTQTTFFYTDTGNTGGSHRVGTIEMNLRAVKTTGGPTATYNCESDGSPSTAPSTFTATTDRGWMRSNTTLVEEMSNISLGGGQNLPAQYDEDLFIRLTTGAVSYVATALTVDLSAGSLSGSTNSTTAVTRDISFLNVIDNRFPAAVTGVEPEVTVPNATLTGLPRWTYYNVNNADIDVDPRLTCAHLLQLDDNAFGTPPLSEQGSGQRLTSQIGYISTNLRAARGTVVGSVITGGVNTNGAGTVLNIHTTLQDAAGATTAITQDGDLATRGGEDGWMGFLQWTSALPGGTWNKTVSVNSPSDITGANYLLNSTISYTLLAIDPAIRLVIGAGPGGTANEGDHFSPGVPLLVGGSLYNTGTKEMVMPDASPAPFCNIFRFNQTTGKKQYLNASFGWTDTGTGIITSHTLTVSPDDSTLFTKTFSASDTSTANGWDNSDIFYVPTFNLTGTPYSDVIQVITLSGSANKHSAYSFDPLGFLK